MIAFSLFLLLRFSYFHFFIKEFSPTIQFIKFFITFDGFQIQANLMFQLDVLIASIFRFE